jgi:biopolymer transport protein ExbD
MAMSVGPAEGGDEEVIAAINTTPLVDVMLVLLIIFLVTVPVVIQEVNVKLPREVNQARKTKPDNVNLAVNKDGEIFWNMEQLPNLEALVTRLKTVSVKDPQPVVHIRGDGGARYEKIGRVIFAAQRAGISTINFVTDPSK